MPGPAPKPNELKRMLGNPGSRPLPDQKNLIALPSASSEAPAHLTKKQKDRWNQIRSMAPWIAVTDEPLLTALVEKMSRQEQLKKEMKKSQFVLYTDKGYAYANPLFGMLSTIETEIFKLLCQLGLTPVDRSKLGVAEVKARSKIQELLAQKNVSS